MEFKDKLRYLRRRQGLTQKDLAGVLNYGYTAISNYESGKNEPSISDLKKMALFFSVSLDELTCFNCSKSEIRDILNLKEILLNNFEYVSYEGKQEICSISAWVAGKEYK